MGRRLRRRQSPWTPLDNIPIRLNIAGVDVVGTIVRLYPNDMDVRIEDGTRRVKGMHASTYQMGYGKRLGNPDRWHFAIAEGGETRLLTTHGPPCQDS